MIPKLRTLLIVSVSVALLAGAAAIWMQDDPLDEQAVAWMEAVNQQGGSSEGYLYLLGLDAAQEPLAAGRARQAEYRRWLDSRSVVDSSFRPAVVEPLPRSLVEQSCGGEWLYCLEQVLAGKRDVDALLEDGAQVLERYRRVIGFEHLLSRSALTASSPLPSYSALIAGNRLLALQAYRLILEGHADQARALLEADFARWRLHLAEADTLIQKLVISHLMAADVGTLSVLRQRNLIAAPVELEPLSVAERSLQIAMRSEFVMVANGYAAMRDDPQIIREQGRLFMRVLFKPNMSINATLPSYRSVADASQQDAATFVEWLRQPQPAVSRDWRNPVGNVLLDVSSVDMNRYLGRLHDLDARIHLYNRLNTLAPGFTEAQAVAAVEGGNPYAMHPARVLEDKPRWLCYDGPLKDRRHLRCLPLVTGGR
ncbi:hypothetical protein [Stutzerimonas azotifigens]|uniref:DUF4034 domain-containing protein n=1 Tax=Stutzerimonas azotifigens TaxID=291995 RepID=A0ABR5Z676_9GAMM|nr:hypothetical protein [Stutzerimonas azotifigens]MBA1275695.1 hypothetical protein [Stutzerimonas azotifigens]